MELLVTYDVATSESDGAKRLRHVAKACEAYGQRVQKSVFECTLTRAQLEQLTDRLEQIIDEKCDTLRIYRLPSARDQSIRVIGKALSHDLHDPLIV